jgi:hypothetical protein
MESTAFIFTDEDMLRYKKQAALCLLLAFYPLPWAPARRVKTSICLALD